MTYGDFKDLARRAASDKVLGDKFFNIVKNPKYDGYQRYLASMVYKFFDKKTFNGPIKSMSNQQLPNEPILIDQLLGNLNEEKYINRYKTTFVMQN